MRAQSLPLFLGLALAATPALAQDGATAAPAGVAGPQDTEKVKQVIVYGEDPCPPSDGDEILVCARMPDEDRYRIPDGLRSDPNAPAAQSWVNRARSLEYVGLSGTDSCSTAGSMGFTGCFQQLARAAREERQTMLGAATWADAVALARQKRLANIDAEAEAIEAQVVADEAAAAADQQDDAATPPPSAPPPGPADPQDGD